MDDYELFYNCCSRLTKFIEKNMDTTPGFLEQMDRLIFACHYGAPGSAVRFAMTKDLRIRRGKANNGKEQVSIKTDHLIAGESEQPVISPPSGTRGMEASDEESEATTTVGTESRQWTRKRLSTTSHSPPRLPPSKRAKRSSASDLGRGKDGNHEEMATKKSDKEKKRTSTRTSPMQQNVGRRTSRRMTCVHRQVNGVEDDQRNDRKTTKSRSGRCVRRPVNGVGDDQGNDRETTKSGRDRSASSKRQESLQAETGRKVRRSLRRLSKCTNDSRKSTESNEDYQTRSKAKDEAKDQSEKTDTTGSEQDTNVIEEDDPDTDAEQVVPPEREITSNGKQVHPTIVLESPSQCALEVMTRRMTLLALMRGLKAGPKRHTLLAWSTRIT
ncbi:hypothetical protein AM587_10012006 [Phytophthora nicotianae]|uniref:Uncharacterized protein n=1 Tax=Phytophthora nicotianae TaxID=4792 RepID=A0A0W8D2N1_PHYNI|nr:hypothetical protein AM587_10012006 [Phytophthora nicotianae]